MGAAVRLAGRRFQRRVRVDGGTALRARVRADGAPGLHRATRFDLLVTLGRLSVVELHPAALQLGGNNNVTVAAKRALGIGDPMLLERRASDLAKATGVDLGALDLAFGNWERGERARLGIAPEIEPDEDVLDAVIDALDL